MSALRTPCLLLLLSLTAACDDAARAPGATAVHARPREDAGAGPRDAATQDAAEPEPPFEQSCAAFDPEKVHLMGEEIDTSTPNIENLPIFALGGDLTRKCYNFEVTAVPRVRNDGRLLYIASWVVRPYHAVQAMVPDDFDEATGMRVRHDDELVPTPACPEGSTRGIAQFALHPLTGDIYYACECPYDADASCPGGAIFDSHGHKWPRYEALLAVSEHAVFLLSTGPQLRDLSVLSPGADEPTPIDDEDAGIGGIRVAAARSHGAGFRIVTYDEADDGSWHDARLWYVTPDARVRLEGRYPDIAPRHGPRVAIDAEANLYETTFGPYIDGGAARQVSRQALGASTVEIVFDESAQPSGIPLLLSDAAFPTGT